MDNIQQLNFTVNLLQAILWQYNNAVNLQGLLQQKQDWYDTNQTNFWEGWIADVFTLSTATAFGLSVWSIILGQPTYINNGPAPTNYPAWGFGSYRKNFTNGNFENTTGLTYQLPPQWARLVLQLRYFQLTTAGTVPEVNRMLKFLFSDLGSVYLFDRLNMTQKYIFNFQLPSTLSLILQNFDILPRPAGVESSYIQGNLLSWGFGQYHTNFDNGNFATS